MKAAASAHGTLEAGRNYAYLPHIFFIPSVLGA